MKKILIILFIGLNIMSYADKYEDYMNNANNSYMEANYDESLSFYMQAFKEKNNDLEALFGIAKSYERDGELDKSLGVYRKILKLDPRNIQAYRKKLTLNEKNVSKWSYDRKEVYLEAFENFLKRTKYNNSEDIYILGRIYMDDKSFERAYKVFKREQNLDYRNYFGAATTSRFLGRYETSIKYYNKLLDIKPDFYQGYLGLGDAYRLNKSYDKAVQNMEKYLDYKDDENVYIAIADIYIVQKKYNKAKETLEKAQTKFPNSKDIRKNLGDVYSKLGRD